MFGVHPKRTCRRRARVQTISEDIGDQLFFVWTAVCGNVVQENDPREDLHKGTRLILANATDPRHDQPHQWVYSLAYAA